MRIRKRSGLIALVLILSMLLFGYDGGALRIKLGGNKTIGNAAICYAYSSLAIDKQPEAATGNLWDRVVLEVVVSGGEAPLEYQWQYAEAGDSTFYNSTSEGNTSSVLLPPVEELAYDYRCVITDASGETVISDAARVQSNESPADEELPQKFFVLGLGDTLNPTVEDASIPMINRLGCGYDVFGNTAANKYVREPVLDLRRLLADGLVQATRVDHSDTIDTISESIKEYTKKITNKAGVKGGYLCFKGSVDMNFSSEEQKRESNYFATFEHILQRYRTYIVGRTNLKDYIIPEVAEDLADRNRSVEDLFKTYGHYVMVNTIVGGKVVYNCTCTSTAISSYDTFQIEARASCDDVFANFETSYGNQTTTETKQFNRNKWTKIYSDGGDYSLTEAGLRDKDFVQAWEQTLEKKGALVAFDKDVNCLIPIWELCPDQARAEELKAAFEAKARSYEGELPDQKHQSREYLGLLRLGVQTDAQKARKEAVGDHAILIDTDLNLNAGGENIYLAKVCVPGRPGLAITDILISTKHEGQKHSFNHNGQEDQYSLLIKANEYWGGTTYHTKWCDLNYGAGGDKIWLYYTYATGKNKTPIYDIMVYDAGSKKAKGYDSCLIAAKKAAEEGGWEIVCFAHSTTPADLNHNAGGNALFLFIKREK